MSGIGEKLFEFLSKDGDVYAVRDASCNENGEAIRFRYGGGNWILTLDSCGADCIPDDPREHNPWEDGDGGDS